MECKLTPKQKAFCDYYIQTGNGSEAARLAGYKGSNLNKIASENLTKLDIREYVEKRMKELEDKRIANAEEVLQYLTKVMRGEEKDQLGLDASLQDRTKAAELLGKRYRLFIEKQEVKADISETVQFVDDLEEMK